MVLTSPQTTLPSGGALLLGVFAVARDPDSRPSSLWWDSLLMSSSTLPCAWRNNRGSQGAVCSALFQISFPHQSDHQPGSAAEAGGAVWPQGAGRREEGGECKTFWEAALWPQAQSSFPGLSLPLWNALDLRFRLLTPLKCPMLDDCWFGGSGREPSKSSNTGSLARDPSS